METFLAGLKKSENIPVEPDSGNAGEGIKLTPINGY